MSTCQYTPHLTPYLLGDLPRGEAREVQRHLEACDVCRAERAAIAPILETLESALASDGAIPAELTDDRVSHILSTPPNPSRDARRTRFKIPLSLYPWLAFAASIALAIRVLPHFSSEKRHSSIFTDISAADSASGWFTDQVLDEMQAPPLEQISDDIAYPNRKLENAPSEQNEAIELPLGAFTLSERNEAIELPSGALTLSSEMPAGRQMPVDLEVSEIAASSGQARMAEKTMQSPDMRRLKRLDTSGYDRRRARAVLADQEPTSTRETKQMGKDVQAGQKKDAPEKMRVYANKEALRIESDSDVAAIAEGDSLFKVENERAQAGAAPTAARPLSSQPALAASPPPPSASKPAPTAAPQPPPPLFNPVVSTLRQPFSTFAIDVDTASYALVRQSLRNKRMPDPSLVRSEEIINYFDYGDRAPDQATFRIFAEGAPAPFAPGRHLLRLGIKGRRLGREEQRLAMLTFVVDASGSMGQPDRMGFARQALDLLAAQLAPEDRVQLVTFNENATLQLPPTPNSDGQRLLAALDQARPTGPTNLERGLALAYEQAAAAFAPGAENRVILISDGVANLGASEASEILARIDGARRKGITLTVFGVGRGSYNDAMLEQLANSGDGSYHYLDSVEEIQRVFVDDLAATLYNIASDVKIQVEWNHTTVPRYRQIGYENRALAAEQFRDDSVDAGEVGSGQAVTALYEFELAHPDAAGQIGRADAPPLGTVRVRYRPLGGGPVQEISRAIEYSDLAPAFEQARPQFRLAAAAAAFSERLRQSPHAANARFGAIADLLRPLGRELGHDRRVVELEQLAGEAHALSQ